MDCNRGMVRCPYEIYYRTMQTDCRCTLCNILFIPVLLSFSTREFAASFIAGSTALPLRFDAISESDNIPS